MSHKIVVIVSANLKRLPERRLQIKWRRMQFWRHSSFIFWHKQDLHHTSNNLEKIKLQMGSIPWAVRCFLHGIHVLKMEKKS